MHEINVIPKRNRTTEPKHNNYKLLLLVTRDLCDLKVVIQYSAFRAIQHIISPFRQGIAGVQVVLGFFNHGLTAFSLNKYYNYIILLH